MCSRYGAQKAYATYPEYNESWYQEPSQDPYNNMTTQSVQQAMQLNRNALMPGSWNATGAAKPARSMKDDWTRYAVTEKGVDRYISSSGAVRFRQIDRSSTGRRLGAPNLLRSQPTPAMTVRPGASVMFNDSSDRIARATPEMRP